MAEGIPVQKVLELRNQGADNNKIIETLRGENFSFQQIRDAIQQADIKKDVTGPVSAPQVTPNAAPSPVQGTPPAKTIPMPEPKMPSTVSAPSPTHNKSVNIDLDEIQRVLEEIIEEKWKESEKVINNMKEWKAVVNTKIKEFDTRISEFNARVDSLNNILGQKAEAFNETMQNVDSEVKALEKALNRLVPTLSDNISELKTLVSDIKK